MRRNELENEVDLTLFIACYNEEKNIVGTLDTVLSALEEFDFTWEIIIIDDASTDRSVEVIQDYLEKHPDLPITLKACEVNVGLAQNYIEGAFMGRGKYYRLICGDNVEPKETLVQVFNQMGKADLVLFYQDCEGKALGRKALSRCYTFLVNRITGYRVKYYNGMPLLQRYHVMRWHTNYHGFGFQADMVARLLDEGFTYTEVGVKGIERKTGKSHALTLRNMFSVTHTLMDLCIRRVGHAWRRSVQRKKAAKLAAARALQHQAP